MPPSSLSLSPSTPLVSSLDYPLLTSSPSLLIVALLIPVTCRAQDSGDPPETAQSDTQSVSTDFPRAFGTAVAVGVITVLVSTIVICAFAHCWQEILLGKRHRRLRRHRQQQHRRRRRRRRRHREGRLRKGERLDSSYHDCEANHDFGVPMAAEDDDDDEEEVERWFVGRPYPGAAVPPPPAPPQTRAMVERAMGSNSNLGSVIGNGNRAGPGTGRVWSQGGGAGARRFSAEEMLGRWA
ncbi:hypothetical protein F4775DRAFT_589157 [Biscogniauxia sp. FL1348]|nr:hypothetical protein F4775DRAFT_589157 [Biscogniauxia sp. FL1348]